MRTSRRHGERGMALAVAIFAMVVIGALVAGAFFAGYQEQRTGRSSLYASAAQDAAEAGTAEVMADWDQFNLNSIAVGGTLALPKTTLPGRTAYQSTVDRLNNDLFLIRSTGSRNDLSGNVLAQRSVGLLARLSYVTATANAAVTVTKPIKFNGNAFEVIGNDSVPQGWGGEPDCNTGVNKAGVRSATTTGAGGGDADNLFGNPPQVANDPTVTNDFFNIFGDVTFDELKQNADIVISSTTPQKPEPTLTGGTPQRCNVSDMNNWGEPRRSPDAYVAKCTTYFPIIYASGSQLKMSGGSRGQGLLLIEGDLEIVGGFEFAGLIVAKGGIKINGNGNKVTGALLAQDVAIDDQNSISGNTTLQFSSCALNKAIQGSAFGEPLAYRSWVQLY
jgi:Tfp pilus assembly protein PilX